MNIPRAESHEVLRKKKHTKFNLIFLSGNLVKLKLYADTAKRRRGRMTEKETN